MISGLPGSGKSTLARRLGPILNLPVIDKDEILERLFESKGTGDSAWRRALSRESDLLLQAEALASGGAILVSFWRVPGMAAGSGTPAGWLLEIPGRVVHVHCVCEPKIAAVRFAGRRRHTGHLDGDRSETGMLASILALSQLPPLEIGHRIDVDMSEAPRLDDLCTSIAQALRD